MVLDFDGPNSQEYYFFLTICMARGQTKDCKYHMIFLANSSSSIMATAIHSSSATCISSLHYQKDYLSQTALQLAPEYVHKEADCGYNGRFPNPLNQMENY